MQSDPAIDALYLDLKVSSPSVYPHLVGPVLIQVQLSSSGTQNSAGVSTVSVKDDRVIFSAGSLVSVIQILDVPVLHTKGHVFCAVREREAGIVNND